MTRHEILACIAMKYLENVVVYLALFKKQNVNTNMYAEVEILVASNWRPLVYKILIASNLMLITVSSNVDLFYFILSLKQ
jgi:hypothetical protein